MPSLTQQKERERAAGRDAQLYIRRNGSFGAKCDGVLDTGHHITEDSGRFTVMSIHDEDREICSGVSRQEAENAIAHDWRQVSTALSRAGEVDHG